MKMVYRSLYFFTQGHHRGQTDDVVSYPVADTKLLVSSRRKLKSAHPSAVMELFPMVERCQYLP